MTRSTCALLAVSLLGLHCAGAQRPTAPPPTVAADWFPLRAGAAWSYDTQTGIGGDTVLSTLAVTSASGGRYTMRSGTRNEVYEVRADGVVREGEYQLRDPLRAGATWEGLRGGRFEIAAMHLQRSVGGNTYQDVIEVRRTGGGIGITTTTYFAPRVGVIEIVAETTSSLGTTLRVRSTLRAYTLGDEPST